MNIRIVLHGFSSKSRTGQKNWKERTISRGICIDGLYRSLGNCTGWRVLPSAWKWSKGVQETPEPQLGKFCTNFYRNWDWADVEFLICSTNVWIVADKIGNKIFFTENLKKLCENKVSRESKLSLGCLTGRDVMVCGWISSIMFPFWENQLFPETQTWKKWDIQSLFRRKKGTSPQNTRRRTKAAHTPSKQCDLSDEKNR